MLGDKPRVAGARSLIVLAAGLALLAAAAFAQQGGELPKGIGPIQELALPETVDDALAAEGQATFTAFCSACHKFGERYVGPDLAGVTQRRAPEWIMNMVLNTNEMIFNDDTAYELLAEYMTPMAQLPLTEEQVRGILEYFRQVDAGLGS
jgi:mono/diheme cytochrome c family protein